MSGRCVVIAIGCLAVLALLPAQTESPQFEVASIKPSAPETRGATIYNPTRERFAINGIDAKDLIAYAYDVREFQIAGGPHWIDSDQYDIVAKPEGDASLDRARAMTRGLLAERFELKLHHESKEMPVFALVVAKGGAKLQRSTSNWLEVRGGRKGNFTARKITMPLLAAQLADRVLGRPVLDRTGISGEFDVDLTWAPDQSVEPGPSIFTALEEQLGLKLETQRSPVDILVIDRIERPSAN